MPPVTSTPDPTPPPALRKAEVVFAALLGIAALVAFVLPASRDWALTVIATTLHQ